MLPKITNSNSPLAHKFLINELKAAKSWSPSITDWKRF